MTFKKYKLKKKKEREVAKQMVVTKEIKVPQTHIKRDFVDIVINLLQTKTNTGLRKIIDAPTNLIAKDFYILTNKILEICLEDNFNNILCFKALNKLINNENKKYTHELFFKYLEASICSNRNFDKLLDFCIKKVTEVVIKNKDKICKLLDDPVHKQRVLALNSKKKRLNYDDTILYFGNSYYIRDGSNLREV